MNFKFVHYLYIFLVSDIIHFDDIPKIKLTNPYRKIYLFNINIPAF